MRVRFGTVEEFLEELGLAVDAPPAAMTPPILRLSCTYTPVQGQVLRATVVAGVLIHRQLIELQQYCGNVWDKPGARMVKKLMRLRARSISGALRAVHDIESGLDVLCRG